eukprot:Gb_34852 [translate_table: standard]
MVKSDFPRPPSLCSISYHGTDRKGNKNYNPSLFSPPNGPLLGQLCLGIPHWPEEVQLSPSASIPDGVLQRMVKMQSLNLSGLRIQSVPHDLQLMKELEQLRLRGTLSYIPSWICSFRNLMVLQLEDEFGRARAFPILELRELPWLEDGEMPKLKHLEFVHCSRLQGLSELVDKLHSLEELIVNRSGLSVDDMQRFRAQLSHVKIQLI